MTELIQERRIARIDRTERRESQPAFLKLAGWNGVVATIAFVATIIATQVSSISSPDGPGGMMAYLDEVAQSGPPAYVYGIAGVILVFLYIPMAVGLYRMLSETTTMWYGSASVVIGLLVLLPAYLINLLAPAGMVGLRDAVGADALYANFAMAATTAELFFTIGSILSLGIGPLLWGLGWLRSMETSRWLGWVGVLTGITGAVWFVWLNELPLIGILLIVNVLASLIFFAGASVVLVRRGADSSRFG